MDTYDQFRESERRTFWFRAAVGVVAVIVSAAMPGASYSIVGAVAVAAAVFLLIAVPKLALLPKFRSDAWIYGQLVADVAVGTAMLAVFGPLSPALAWPAFCVAYYSLFLGRNGAAAAVAGGMASMIPALIVTPDAFPVAPVLAFTTLGGTALITSLLAMDRFNERARRNDAEELVAHEARSSRVLAGLMRMSNARGDREVAAALADAIRTASHYQAAACLITRQSDGALVPIAWRLDAGQAPATGQAVELPDSPTPGAISARQGSALVIDSPSDMPVWASEIGFVSGLVLPITRGMEMLGVVYALRRVPSVISVSEIEQLELVVAFASRLFSSAGMGPNSASGSLDSLLSRRAHEEESGRRGVSLPGINLDPARERAEVNDVSVSLSKTEFALLYALASDPGEVFAANVLAQTCWEGDTPNDNAVDVTVYRLRRKLARVPGGHDLIQTVRGRGYTFQAPAAQPVGIQE